MKLLITILLLTTAAKAQSVDSIINARFSRMLSDSMKASDSRFQGPLRDSLRASEARYQKAFADSATALLSRFQQMLKDSMTVGQIRLDSTQFEIVNGVVRLKAKRDTVKRDSVIVVTPVPRTNSNLLTFPDQFESSVWEKSNGATLLPDQIIGPDSLKSADLFGALQGIWKNLLRRQYKFDNVSYTQTVYFKKATTDYVGIRIAGAIKASFMPFVNLATLAVNTQGLAGVTLKAEQVGNGWVKVTLTFTPTAGLGFYEIAIVNSNGNSAATLTGNEKVYVGRAELILTPTQGIIRRGIKKASR